MTCKSCSSLSSNIEEIYNKQIDFIKKNKKLEVNKSEEDQHAINLTLIQLDILHSDIQRFLKYGKILKAVESSKEMKEE